MYVYMYVCIGLPFTKAIQEAIKGEFISRFNIFVLDVKAKADAHKEKVYLFLTLVCPVLQNRKEFFMHDCKKDVASHTHTPATSKR
jgi:hypothetical protein